MIDAFCWVTKDRSEALDRSINFARSQIQNLKSKDTIRFYAFEDGNSTLNRNDHLICFNRQDRKQFCDWLNTHSRFGKSNTITEAVHFLVGLDDPVIDWTTGANANFMNLMMYGKKVLTLDDDIVLDGIKVTNDQITNNIKKRKYFLNQLELQDYYAKHNGNTSRLLSELNEVLDDPDNAIASIGILGDTGSPDARGIFNHTYEEVENILLEPELFYAAITNRLIHRYVSQRTAMKDFSFMTTCYAINHKHPIPPFFPYGRNHDGFFSFCLKIANPISRIIQIPYSVLHSPIEERMDRIEDLKKLRLRMNDFLIFAAADFLTKEQVSITNSFERIKVFSQFLISITELSDLQFLNYFQSQIQEYFNRRSNRLKGILSQSILSTNRLSQSADHKYYIDLVRSEIHLMGEFFQREGNLLPSEFDRFPNVGEAISRMKSDITKFAIAITIWPELKERALEY
jgi:hypothetical protein